jgi:hypothetical protein
MYLKFENGRESNIKRKKIYECRSYRNKCLRKNRLDVDKLIE